jgi:ABC-type branched-subunit amino acid transport system ATPase component
VHRALEFADFAILLSRGKVAWQGESGTAKSEVIAHYLGETAAVGVG